MIRTYTIGDTIPGYGTVTYISATAYEIDGEGWVPFYGPNGVDTPLPSLPLVTFA